MNPLLRAAYAGAGGLARLIVATGLPGNSKVAQSVNARRGLLDRYRAFAVNGRDMSRPLVWFHAPSVGEGLQATPVIARLKASRPDLQIAYTHFSPSATSFARRTGADFSDYLPFDDAHSMRVALESLAPAALVFSKLDVWPNLVSAARTRGVPRGLISATLAEGSGRRGGVAAALLRDAYASLDAVGAIDDADAARLVGIGVNASVIRVTGDTRYDQVWARAAAASTVAPWLDRFRTAPRVTLVAGSTWPSDDAVLLPTWAALARTHRDRVRLIVAPHEPTAAHLAPVEAWAAAAGLTCTRLDATGDSTSDVVLVDRVGVLGELYALADAAYVGGGFHAAGLHSVLEPAAFGAPVLFGPRFTNSRDAEVLIRTGGAQAVHSVDALRAALGDWLDPERAASRHGAGAAARSVVQSGLGAADRATAMVEALIRSATR
jgi:3-deoxy-D-manno-octulosonic-acid transferase